MMCDNCPQDYAAAQFMSIRYTPCIIHQDGRKVAIMMRHEPLALPGAYLAALSNASLDQPLDSRLGKSSWYP